MNELSLRTTVTGVSLQDMKKQDTVTGDFLPETFECWSNITAKLCGDKTVFEGLMDKNAAELYRRVIKTQLRGRKHGDEAARYVVRMGLSYVDGIIDDAELDDGLREVVFRVFDKDSWIEDHVDRLDGPMLRLWHDLRYIVRHWHAERT